MLTLSTLDNSFVETAEAQHIPKLILRGVTDPCEEMQETHHRLQVCEIAGWERKRFPGSKAPFWKVYQLRISVQKPLLEFPGEADR